MAQRRDVVANIGTAVLVLCAIVVTTLVTVQFVSAHKSTIQVSRHIKNPEFLSTDRRVNIGNNRASLKIIEFSDYQCPYCRELEPNLQALVRRYPNKVAVVRYDLPLENIHAYAYKAAIASRCAALQRVYEPFEAKLFKTKLEKANWSEIARAAKVPDIAKFSACVSNNQSASLVEADIKTAHKLGIKETPTLVINGDIIPGMQREQVLNRMVSGG